MLVRETISPFKIYKLYKEHNKLRLFLIYGILEHNNDRSIKYLKHLRDMITIDLVMEYCNYSNSSVNNFNK